MNDSVKGVGAVSLGAVGVGGHIPSGIDADGFARARDFVLRNARLVDRHLFACLFEGASNESVRYALRAYRNPDGGFGNALEPDKRCPDSQPVDAEVALKILDLVDGFDDPMVAPVLRTGLHGRRTHREVCRSCCRAQNNYPHAPWWEAPPEPPPSINPTGSIVAILSKRKRCPPPG